ncbi:MAG: DUF192 domain-containing protein [Gammaproteobacteria bacterium]
MLKSFFATVMLIAGGIVSGGSAVAQDQAPEPLSAFPQSLLAIRTTAGNVINFKIWQADSPRREEQGLMFVHEMDEHAGMLFVFPGNQSPTMWMKNTYIPLDLLFVSEHGRIEYIAASATPLSLDVIQSPKPSLAVLELKGGACAHLGIKVGDTVLHSSLSASHPLRKLPGN